jgi:hypothetical protein
VVGLDGLCDRFGYYIIGWRDYPCDFLAHDYVVDKEALLCYCVTVPSEWLVKVKLNQLVQAVQVFVLDNESVGDCLLQVRCY